MGEQGEDPRGWYTRGWLPHFDGGETAQSVTFTLADALPEDKLLTLEQELRLMPDRERSGSRRVRIDELLNGGHGHRWLGDPALADLVEGALRHFDGQRYDLHAWVVMPNHVHALLTPGEERRLADIVRSWKTFTARRANAYLGLEGRFWQREYFDRYIRDERHFETVVRYIENNPVVAGLCEAPEDWRWGSARLRRD